MTEVGKAELTIIPVFKGGQKALERQLSIGGGSSGLSMGAVGKKAGAAFSGGLTSIVAPAMAALSVGAAVNFAQGAIDEASSLGESLNALEVVYGNSATGISKIGEEAARTLGLSNLQFNNLAVQFAGFGKTIAGEGGDVVGTLEDLTGRAADFASVMNLEVSEAAQLFQSGLAGESEPLRRYSIDLSAAAVDAYAYANGIAETGEQLTEAEKVQARYGLLMQETNQTAGDFANTSDSLANQQRILAAEWDNLRAELGTELLPVMQDVTGWLLDEGLPGLKSFIDDLDDPSTTIGGIAESLSDLWDEAQPGLASAFETGGSFAEAFFGGLAAAIESYEGGTLGDDWASGAMDAGQGLSEWAASGDNAGKKFVSALDGVIGDYVEGGLGLVWEDWEAGVKDAGVLMSEWAAENDGWAAEGIQAFDDTFASWFGNETSWMREAREAEEAAQYRRAKPYADGQPGPTFDDPYGNVGNYALEFYPREIIAEIQAPADANYGTTIYIGTVNASDTEDIVRKGKQAARTDSWSGSRGGRINPGMR